MALTSGLSFNGTSDDVKVAHNALLNLGNTFTMEFWAFPDNSDNNENIFSKTQDGNKGWEVVQKSTGSVQWNEAGRAALTVGGFDAGSWHHVAISRSQTGSAVIFVNGDAKGTFSQTGSPLASTTALTFGEHTEVADFQVWAGDLDEIRISNTGRYISNFTPPTTQFDNDANTVALWHLNEITNGSVTDSSSNGFTGDVNGATLVAGNVSAADVPVAIPAGFMVPSKFWR